MRAAQLTTQSRHTRPDETAPMRQRCVIVTGAAGGLGKGLAQCFAQDGYLVALADLDGDAARDEAARLTEAGHTAIGVEVDVTDESSAATMAGQVEAHFGSLDILVNNAGLFGDPAYTGPVMDVDLETWNAVLNVNLGGILIASRAVAPAMRKAGWGRIVNISSMAAYTHAGVYSVSKLAVHQLNWSLAAELGRDGITVNCIGPGTMDTESMRRNRPDESALQERIENMFIIKRIGKPEDIYAATSYFVSDEAEWCTGQVLLVNGGAIVRL